MKLAASIVLYRTVPNFEVLVIKRSASLSFLSGYIAFPGGMSEMADTAPTTLEIAKNCGLRELGEELGLAESFCESLRPLLIHIGTWATPEYLGQNFDTYFFAVEVDEQMPSPVIAPQEVDEYEWIEPRALSLRWERCSCLLAPPTQAIIRRLSEINALAKLRDFSEMYGMPPRYALIRPYITLFPQHTPTLPPATHTNCYIVGHDELIIVEPATDSEWEDSALRLFLEDQLENGKRIKAIVLTHHHHDHCVGVPAMVKALGLEVWAHPETAKRIDLPVSRELEDGDLIELDGGLCLEVFHTPGHAPGHIVLLDERSQSLIAGDMVAGLGSIIIDPSDGGDMREYFESLHLLKSLNASCLLPSHGPVIGGAEEKLNAYISHRSMREALVLNAVGDAPVSLEHVVSLAYQDTPDVLKSGPGGGLAGRSALAHLNKLVDEGKLVLTDDNRYQRHR